MTDMALEIRPYNQEDYPQLATVLANAKPYAAVSAEILRYRDQARPAFCQFQRFVAVLDDDLVGFCLYTQYADMFEPDAFWADVCVSPRHQKQGIGSALYSTLLQSLSSGRPVTLRTQIREDDPTSIKFAQRRGFLEFGRRWESSLDVATFDEKQFPDYKAQLKAQGIEIVSFTDLAGDPQRDQELYQLQTELDQDVPMLVPVTPMTFAHFSNQVLKNPALVAGGLMIATDGNEYVGMSSLFEINPKSLVIDLTGTKAAYRRRGIAMALKLQGIVFARERGYEKIEVHNDTANQGMIAINERLGFVRAPALIQYARELVP